MVHFRLGVYIIFSGRKQRDEPEAVIPEFVLLNENEDVRGN